MESTAIKFEKTKYHVLDVAAYCLQNFEFNCFKLQKTLYYIQAAFVVKKSRPCFLGKIVKAEFGPVIPTIENMYSIFGNQIIRLSEDKFFGNASLVDANDRKLIDRVCELCEQMSGNDLSIKTHQEDPWMKAEMDDVISCISIMNYYSKHKAKLIC